MPDMQGVQDKPVRYTCRIDNLVEVNAIEIDTAYEKALREAIAKSDRLGDDGLVLGDIVCKRISNKEEELLDYCYKRMFPDTCRWCDEPIKYNQEQYIVGKSHYCIPCKDYLCQHQDEWPEYEA